MAFLEFYKKGQGSVGRWIALLSSYVLIAWGGYALWVQLQGSTMLTRVIVTIPHINFGIDWTLVICVVIVLAGCVGATWIWNRPKNVDLLVETEAEMKKVSWPSLQEAWNSSIVVVVTVVFLMGLLFLYDFLWNFLLERLFT